MVCVCVCVNTTTHTLCLTLSLDLLNKSLKKLQALLYFTCMKATDKNPDDDDDNDVKC